MSGEQFLVIVFFFSLAILLIAAIIFFRNSRKEVQHLVSSLTLLKGDVKSGYKSLAQTEHRIAGLLEKIETSKVKQSLEEAIKQARIIAERVDLLETRVKNGEKNILSTLASAEAKDERDRRSLEKNADENFAKFSKLLDSAREKAERVFGEIAENTTMLCQQIKQVTQEQHALHDDIGKSAGEFTKRVDNLHTEVKEAIIEKTERISGQIKAVESKAIMERSALDGVKRESENFREKVDSLGDQLDSLESKVEMQDRSWQSVVALVEKIEEKLEPISREVKSWSNEPIARRKDLDKKKIAVFIDFENAFISLCKMGLEITDYREFKNFLLDPKNIRPATSGRIILFTNKSRWLRKDHYDKNNDIDQNYARKVKKALKQEGIRIVEPDSNVDIPLTLLAIAMVEKSEIEEIVLVANDGTYAGLVSKLSDMGCLVSGILFGNDAAGDLIACYKELGFEKYHVKSQDQLPWFSAIPANPASAAKNSSEKIPPNIHKKFNKLAKKFCFVPYRKDRIAYLEHAFDIFTQSRTMSQMRAELKADFPEANVFCRNTVGKILLQSGNVEEIESGKYKAAVKSRDVWMQNAETAWLKAIIACIARLEEMGKIQAGEFSAKAILQDVLGYPPEYPGYEEITRICHLQMEKYGVRDSEQKIANQS